MNILYGAKDYLKALITSPWSRTDHQNRQGASLSPSLPGRIPFWVTFIDIWYGEHQINSLEHNELHQRINVLCKTCSYLVDAIGEPPEKKLLNEIKKLISAVEVLGVEAQKSYHKEVSREDQEDAKWADLKRELGFGD